MGNNHTWANRSEYPAAAPSDPDPDPPDPSARLTEILIVTRKGQSDCRERVLKGEANAGR
jgi:hypothetical protein